MEEITEITSEDVRMLREMTHSSALVPKKFAVLLSRPARFEKNSERSSSSKEKLKRTRSSNELSMGRPTLSSSSSSRTTVSSSKNMFEELGLTSRLTRSRNTSTCSP